MGGYNLNLKGKSKVDVDLDGDGTVDFGASASSVKEYFVEFNKSGYMMGTTLQDLRTLISMRLIVATLASLTSRRVWVVRALMMV